MRILTPRSHRSPSAARRRRSAAVAVVAATALLGGVLLTTGPAAAAGASAVEPVVPAPGAAASIPAPGPETAPAPDPAPADGPVVMGDYSLDAYAERIDEVPAELSQALADDLGETPEGYLANADAAADAVAVVDQLSASGVDVLGSRLEGTALVVNVPDEAAAAAVEAVNATAEIGAPAPVDLDGQTFELKRDLVGGQGYFSQDTRYRYLCSAAFNGLDRSTGRNQFLTAGHCREEGTLDNGRVTEQVQSKPGTAFSAGVVLGQPVENSFDFSGKTDDGLIATDAAWTPRPAVGVWGGSNSAPVTAGTPQTVRDYGDAIVGQNVCKSGRTTGWTCGTVKYVDEVLSVGGGKSINADIVDGMCALQGDSGGAVVSGAYAMGLLSAGTYESCTQTGRFSAVFPMVSNVDASVLASEKNWDILADVAAPVVSSPSDGSLQWGSPVAGTVPFGGVHHTVRLVVDGSRTYTGAVAQDGSWAILPTDLASGPHSYTLTARFGQGAAVSSSPAVSGTFTVSGRPDVSRIDGADRFQVAVNISRTAFPGSAPVVYVTTGADYPDALSAGPAAASQGGPLLLVTRDSIPAVVSGELQRLSPDTIRIVGGPNSVSESVKAALQKLVPDAAVSRVTGADRFAVSRGLASSVFGTAPHAYVATGTNFPDALVAGAAAGSKGEPVVLVNGPQPTADAPTVQAFRALTTSAITVVGGPNSVSPGVVSALQQVPAAVDRVSGADRFDAAIALNRSAFTSASTVYLATGYTFPDALAGGVLAGIEDSPLYIAPTTCVPRGVLADIVALGATKVVLLGGPVSLTPAAAALTACAG